MHTIRLTALAIAAFAAFPAAAQSNEELLKELRALDPHKPVFIEGESRKIGQLHVPETLIERMRAAECVRLETGLETRVTLLLDEYRHFLEGNGALEAQLDCLAGLHGREKIAQWKTLAARGAWREFVACLLTEHYDPAYRKSSARNFSRLGEAGVVRIASASDAAFAQAAAELAGRMPERAAA